MTVFTDVTKEDAAKLIQKGFTLTTTKTIHEDLRLTKGTTTLILYKSGKLLIQGKNDISEDLTKWGIGKQVKKESFRKETGWIIGSDESIKGDSFGGLVVAAVKADDNLRKKLIEIGVADSKKLADSEIVKMAEEIKKAIPCEVKSLYPQDYNKYNKQTELMNKLHKQCADFLKPGKHIVDKYPGCKIGDVAEEKAESKYIEVAAASVLARAAALAQFDALSMQAGFELPKGSTHVAGALKHLKEKNLNPKNFVKLHFRNVQEILK